MAKMHKVQGESMMGHPLEGSQILPSFGIGEEDLPELKGWKVGQVYDLKIQVRLSSMSMNGAADPLMKKKMRGYLEIVKIGEESDSYEEEMGKMGHK